jgi:signal transduction histidine kinase
MRGYSKVTGAPAHAALGEIRAAQVGAVFRHMPIALAVNAANSAITVIVLQRLAPMARPLAWFCVVTLVTAARLVVWRQYRRAQKRSESGPDWSLLTTCGSLGAGLCWGLGGVILFPIMPVPGQIFFTFVIGGMCAGAVVLSAAHLPTLIAFLLATSLPMAALFFSAGAATGSALGAMVLIFAAALSLAGTHLNRFFVETIRLRLKLNAADFRLRAEVAQRQATEAALRQAQKLEAIGQLTGGIAHDFNNLLTVVIGNLVLAIERAGESSPGVAQLHGALQAAERGVALVQRLLAFARKQRLEPQSVDLRGLVSSIDDLLRRTLGAQIRLEIAAAGDVAPARVDANQLELALLNLTINARDAMPNGGALRIGLENRSPGPAAPPELPPGGYVVLSISDSGVGMDEATLTRAFDPFFTTKGVGSGSGLGLPMVQGFAVQSGGTVQIRSEPGQGTTVELWLPQANEAPSQIIGADRPLSAQPEGGPLPSR